MKVILFCAASLQPQREDNERASSAQTPAPSSAAKAEPSRVVTDASAASSARPEKDQIATAAEPEPRKATAAELEQAQAAEPREATGGETA